MSLAAFEALVALQGMPDDRHRFIVGTAGIAHVSHVTRPSFSLCSRIIAGTRRVRSGAGTLCEPCMLALYAKYQNIFETT